jgi:hypothetical protein
MNMTYIPKPLSFWEKFSPTFCRNSKDWQTPQQGVAIRAISNAQRIDANKASQHLFGYDADSLNRAASSTFIDWLKDRPMQNHPSEALNFCPKCKNLLAEENQALKCQQGHQYEIAAIEAA